MKYILPIIVSAAFLFSCSDSFLDKKPLDKLSEKDVYSNEALLEAYVNSFYTVLPDPFTEGNIACITDEAFFRYGGTSTGYITRGLMTPDNVMYIKEGGSAHNTRTTFLNIWNSTYSYIRNMNEFLSKIDDLTVLSEVKKNQLKGETLFLRAWAYTNLVQRYGGVPLITKLYGIQDNFGIKRDSFDDCIDFILSDLDEAKDLLPDKANDLGRIGRDACLALESRITLIAASPLFNDPSSPTGGITKGTYNANKWIRALNAAKAIVDRADQSGAYSLGTYDEYWTNVNCKEVIWGKFFSTTSGSKAQLYYAPEYFNGWTSCEPCEALIMDYEMAATGMKFFEAGSGYNPAQPWAGRDPRFYKTIIYPDCIFRDSVYNNHIYYNETGSTVLKRGRFWRNESDDTGYNLKKWHRTNATISENENTTIMFPWFRLAEFYLNYAEAAYMTGDEDICRTYINKVRSRPDVMMPEVRDAGKALFDRLVNERRIELAFEPFRYFDLRRWKLAPFYENIPMMGIGVLEFPDGTIKYRVVEVANDNAKESYGSTWKYNSEYTYTYNWKGTAYKIDFGSCKSMMGIQKAFSDKDYLMPIPRNEITKSEGSIEQNPYYQ
ncbi:MAG: RagB/SusD family nutrient uptake outer membrane protein [Dysgonamonadaceae bacterium]|jgi:hypothetical protein|nr:RagB/SusD family nutrient uptake outer membrane protein [Dysgonamonadaceae bacterium]